MNESSPIEIINQSYQALKTGGLFIHLGKFPNAYYKDAVTKAYPQSNNRAASEMQTLAGNPDEQTQAAIAGALIHLMAVYPADCLRAQHDPHVREVFAMAAMFDWEHHISKIRTSCAQTTETEA
jgi:hypothetical protein